MMPIEPDHYGVLELEPGSSMEEVKGQYRRLAKRWHPDLHGNDARSQEQFRRINAAYAFLSDAPRKEAYDACLEAARRIGAPPLRTASPSATGYHAPVTATGYHAPVTATGYHAQVPADVRMTRSAWLGATAGAVVVLLVIGLSLDGSGPRRPVVVERASPAPDRAPSGVPEDGAVAGDETAPVTAPLSTPPPSATFAAPAVGAPQVRPHPLPPGVPAPLRRTVVTRAAVLPAFRADNAGTALHASEANPVDALKQRLQARYQAALPRADQLLNRGYAVRASHLDAEDGSRRILRDQLAADMAELSATRARIRPAIARLPRQGTPQDLQQDAGPILADLRHLEDAQQPVRDDIKALSSAFHFTPPAPARTASVVPTAHAPAAPAAPAPRVATTIAPEAPKPPDTPPTKPKAPASAGQEFIMWGK